MVDAVYYALRGVPLRHGHIRTDAEGERGKERGERNVRCPTLLASDESLISFSMAKLAGCGIALRCWKHLNQNRGVSCVSMLIEWRGAGRVPRTHYRVYTTLDTTEIMG